MKKMLINAVHPEEIRVAVVQDGLLTELHVESTLKQRFKGNIYKGRITRVEKSLNAVFVNYGREKNGFLPFHDMHPAFIPQAKGMRDLPGCLKPGMDIPVQVVREEKDAKGALLTMQISLPGRYMVLVPHQQLTGISRKIEDEEQRRRLKEIMGQLNPPEGIGLIVRTAGMGKTKNELSRDMNYLLRLWKSIEESLEQQTAPALLYREGDIITRSIRDYFTTDMSEVLIDDEQTHRRALLHMKTVMPRYRGKLKHYHDVKPLFNKYELERQIQDIYHKQVVLQSGGTLVIEQTEAMVVIDVNSGKSTAEAGIEGTAFATNMEAAAEIARQLVLRDLGGLVVIDFIDMRGREHNRKVEKALKDGLKADRAHLVFGRISEFGIMQLSREKLSPTLMEKSHVPCPCCEGTGLVRSVASSAFMALRELQQYLNRNKNVSVQLKVPREVALYLLNHQRGRIRNFEERFGTSIEVVPDDELYGGQATVISREGAG